MRENGKMEKRTEGASSHGAMETGTRANGRAERKMAQVNGDKQTNKKNRIQTRID